MFLTASCGDKMPKEPDPSPTSIANSYRVSHKWISTEALRPESAEGSIVRAALESDEILISTVAREAQYPGFIAASDQYYENSHTPGDPYDNQFAGAVIFTPTERQVLASGLAFTVCMVGRVQAKTDRPQNLFQFVSRIEIATTGTPPPRNQVGSADRPSSNMFGDWRIRDIKLVDNHPATPPLTCQPAFYEQHKNDPASPGWPTSPELPPSSSTEPR
ncbi:hypothetical protein [Williamsia sp.]|uniref:hypothetical protein n=1 Tax=Williamsia sp. TaxID=1872085 RepID=UPI001A1F6B80|nr:hypothetical protein [Williamsia sp.]MBJ7291137.1 hypothetical protein [Williamsia sp.]